MSHVSTNQAYKKHNGYPSKDSGGMRCGLEHKVVCDR